MKALHFGAGNIGRGFVGILLHEAGYELVFADVAAPLIDSLNEFDSYTVHEVGAGARDVTVTGFSGVNSGSDLEGLYEQIVDADLITTAVGPTVLRIIAPTIAEGLKRRAAAGKGKVAVMACENAINATDGLAEAIREVYPEVDEAAFFANTAVDRIVPNQERREGTQALDVTVETYHEWAVESGPFNENVGEVPNIPGITWVEDLAPYITRKLFTVNTGHAATAYFGNAAGISKIADALADASVQAKVAAVLAETKQLIVEKFGFEPEVQQAYVEKILTRFQNPDLPDTTDRVGRAPLRKISRNERFIGPAAELAERGYEATALVGAVAAALQFNVAEDAESVELQEKLTGVRGDRAASDALVTELTGIAPEHPLFAALAQAFATA
ncbi:mannitol-1-phosphate 5-dehydrogenase [Corynebacterium striatum]|uniref:mannitol-1-phosphate 5-dehydrogenase n=1 Tax=Corynebacterium striatum TaxID=43770 RepID=UPI001A1E350B|nr:mannitol-1-phosphate 5-dehydrogenase [Corynebacterium striatum]GKH16200.1 mannitol-1-phosphate 5-dehydrogenase [Corynebacterium striatum]HAT1251431.1 mannitol-1-phosphate 5-dehydrogenase [Corynebacterium striatum]HAT1361712.1 mannitol-1-phosphate 5-dehydrogenase [Corynebacterium striatum]HAT1474075.1 mannitol-1-phosphate 5-dehydrogenase [Corynebacterium striatum]HAT6528726.1 mannitol-1-phosphate 5-dehydrogenase [Corynebacterium striatum]